MSPFWLHVAIGFFIGAISVGWLLEVLARARDRNVKRVWK